MGPPLSKRALAVGVAVWLCLSALFVSRLSVWEKWREAHNPFLGGGAEAEQAQAEREWGAQPASQPAMAGKEGGEQAPSQPALLR